MPSYQLLKFINRYCNIILKNGTGVYARLWDLMEKNQEGNILVESVEKGVKLVRDSDKVAVMAGRETLYFDIQRFGNHFIILEIG